MALSNPPTSSDPTIGHDMLEVCDRYLEPCWLGPFAEDMVHRMSRLSQGPLLEIGAGTGVLTQAAAASMSAGMTIIATDSRAEMVSHASDKPGMARIRWQLVDSGDLPFQDAAFGIVASLFGIGDLHNRVRTFREVRRVLKPVGRFMFGVPAHVRQNPVADCVHSAVEACFPIDPPGFIRQVLHAYHDNEAIDDDLTEAGFTDTIYTSVELPFVAFSARDVAIGYCLGTPLRWEIESRVPGDIQRVVGAVAEALEKRFGAGGIETIMRAHVISASG